MPRLTTIGFDADDTLWENEVHYHAAKRRFAARLSFACPEDKSLAVLDEIEVRNVGVYGYGIKSFSLSMIEAAARLLPDRLEPDLIPSLLSIPKEMLRQPVELIEGVPATLDQLTASYSLVLLTKGDLFEQQLKIKRSGIADRFRAVRVLQAKTAETYAQVLGDLGVPPAEFVMVGNSLRSDILPAVELGARAVFIPHALTWSHEHVQREHLPSRGWTEVASVVDVPSALRAMEAE
jgi:putative hydrolase of the HAD superfamily